MAKLQNKTAIQDKWRAVKHDKGLPQNKKQKTQQARDERAEIETGSQNKNGADNASADESGDEATIPYRVHFARAATKKRNLDGTLKLQSKPKLATSFANPYGKHLDVEYNVKPTPHGASTPKNASTPEWESLKAYKIYKLGDQEFRDDDIIYVKSTESETSNEGQFEEEFDNYWVARGIECRAVDASNVFILVQWLYRPADLPTASNNSRTKKRDSLQSLNIQGEVIPSNHLEIISASSVAQQVRSLESLTLREVKDPAKQFIDLMWYRTLDILSVKQSPLVPIKCKVCDQFDDPMNQDLYRCISCLEPVHLQCLCDDAKAHAEEQLAANAEENDKDQSITLQPSIPSSSKSTDPPKSWMPSFRLTSKKESTSKTQNTNKSPPTSDTLPLPGPQQPNGTTTSTPSQTRNNKSKPSTTTTTTTNAQPESTHPIYSLKSTASITVTLEPRPRTTKHGPKTWHPRVKLVGANPPSDKSSEEPVEWTSHLDCPSCKAQL